MYLLCEVHISFDHTQLSNCFSLSVQDCVKFLNCTAPRYQSPSRTELIPITWKLLKCCQGNLRKFHSFRERRPSIWNVCVEARRHSVTILIHFSGIYLLLAVQSKGLKSGNTSDTDRARTTLKSTNEVVHDSLVTVNSTSLSNWLKKVSLSCKWPPHLCKTEWLGIWHNDSDVWFSGLVKIN